MCPVIPSMTSLRVPRTVTQGTIVLAPFCQKQQRLSCVAVHTRAEAPFSGKGITAVVMVVGRVLGVVICGPCCLIECYISGSHQQHCCYNRQGRKAKNRRSRDSHSNRAYSRTQTVRNTGTHNQEVSTTTIRSTQVRSYSQTETT